MNRVCAWCKKVIEKDDSTDIATHGICEECQKKIKDKF